MKAEDNLFPYVTVDETTDPGPVATGAGHRLWNDSTETSVVGLMKETDSAGDQRPHWPIYVIPNGGSPPAGLAPHTIILEEGP